MRNINTFAALALMLTAGAGQAYAHAHLRTGTPAVDSTVAAPAEVAIVYSEAVEPRFSVIEVKDSTGKRVDKQDVHTAPSDNKVLSVGLPQLAPGVYTVEWHATAVDTHKTEGTFKFTVK